MHVTDTGLTMSSRTYAYCRCSKADQNTENQVLEIQNAGFTIEPQRVVQETVSGSVPAIQRKGFVKLMDKLEAGDVVIVTKLDRLGRNAMDVRSTVETFTAMNVRLVCLALGQADLTSAAGKMTMGVIAAVAEFERDLLIERTSAGLNRAKAEGKTLGRKPSLTPDQKADILKQREADVSLGVLAKQYGVSRSAIQRVEAAFN